MRDPPAIVGPYLEAKLAVPQRDEGVVIQALSESHLIVNERGATLIVGRNQFTDQVSLDQCPSTVVSEPFIKLRT